MILLLLTLANASCSSPLSQPNMEIYIAKTLGDLAPFDGRVFSAAIRGYAYTAVARHFHISVDQVVEITHRGAEIMFKYRDGAK